MGSLFFGSDLSLLNCYVISCLFYATSSEQGGGQAGKYPAKIYTIDGVLIYQEEDGSDNTDKTPKGGVIYQFLASSMMETIANPITYYGGGSYAVINQEGHSGDLYNYYWTSYSRGTDGMGYPTNNPSWHNVYLDGYIPLRAKSIYDPCPYLYRIPSNGTYNQFTKQSGWTWGSYLGGGSWKMNTKVSWFIPGGRNGWSSVFEWTGSYGIYYSGTAGSQSGGYEFEFDAGSWIASNHHDFPRSHGTSVRCIEDEEN